VLRPSFERLTQLALKTPFARILRAGFPVGIILPALAGLMSVSFVSCTHPTYEEIVADGQYLVQKNQEQLMMALYFLLAALLAWGSLALVVLVLGRRAREDASLSRQSPPAAGE
jgi:hypothetical protein